MPKYRVEIEEHTVRTVLFEHEEEDLGQDDISDIASGFSDEYIKANTESLDAEWFVNSGEKVED